MPKFSLAVNSKTNSFARLGSHGKGILNMVFSNQDFQKLKEHFHSFSTE